MSKNTVEIDADYLDSLYNAASALQSLIHLEDLKEYNKERYDDEKDDVWEEAIKANKKALGVSWTIDDLL